MGLVHPIFIDVVIRLDKVMLTTQEEMPSRYANYAGLITQEEAALEMMTVGLASAELFGVRCDPVRLGSNYPVQPALLSFPNFQHGNEVGHPNNIVLLLWEECPSHRQEQLTRILWYQCMWYFIPPCGMCSGGMCNTTSFPRKLGPERQVIGMHYQWDEV